MAKTAKATPIPRLIITNLSRPHQAWFNLRTC